MEETLKIWGQKTFRFFSSFGLATAVLVLMVVVTFFGTIAQVELGIFEAQKRYFDSWIAFHRFGNGFTLPLPGAYPLMLLLFVNMVCGAIIRARKGPKQIGNLISHSGILFLLAGGFVAHHFSEAGHMTLAEGQQSNVVKSYHNWVVEIHERGKDEVLVVGEEVLRDLAPANSVTFTHSSLPFDLTLSGYRRHSNIVAEGPGGFRLIPLKPVAEAERNLGGARATLVAEDGTREDFLMWGGELAPHGTTVDGRDFAISLTRRSWTVPFLVRLDDFSYSYHPGTKKPRDFTSIVYREEAGEIARAKIRMNEPMRHDGFTFFQAQFQDFGNGNVRSIFEVSRNPADQWPLYACIVISLGLLIHFVVKLLEFVGRSRKQRAAQAIA
ncbi:MAG: cytochrome c biogenesis protein ResB [Verrucomicrobiota bacterium]